VLPAPVVAAGRAPAPAVAAAATAATGAAGGGRGGRGLIVCASGSEQFPS